MENSMDKKITIALAGNPNSGKTTIFNNLTGTRQHVGNYPGVTVEKKDGTCRYKGMEIDVVDLPGAYSMTAYSVEELVARNFILDEKPDVVVDIVDASNLERNLYLAVQFIELGVPLVLVFNMSDMAEARGMQFDLERLSQLLGAPIIPAVGNKNKGMDELLDAVIAVAKSDSIPERPNINYSPEVDEEIGRIRQAIEKLDLADQKYDARWLAIKLLENDRDIRGKVDSQEIFALVKQRSAHLETVCGDSPEILIADGRYGFISGACQEAVRSTVETRHTLSDKIDFVMTNRVLGLPIFALLMYLVFQLTFSIGNPCVDFLDELINGKLAVWVGGLWAPGSESLLRGLIVDGIIGGVGAVVVFIPLILLLFLAIAVLEDSGYMARAAFIMDRLMHKIGLHGRSFIPMLIGFGCSVPAIMATRALDSRRDRLTTMLVVPLMSCGARLPIYALIIPAFFPQSQHVFLLFGIYIVGIVLAIICAKLLRSTILRGQAQPFVMELPPYRMPTLQGLFIHMWQRGWLYLKKAGTVILAITIVLWVLTSFPKKVNFDRDYAAEISAASSQQAEREIMHAQRAEELAYTVAGRIGHAMEPAIKPLGFDWKIGTALIGSFSAKEVFVAQMGIVYSVECDDEKTDALRDRLRANYSPLQGICIMLFCLISAPCMVTIAVTRKESNSWGWAMFQLGGLTVLAYVVTLVVYQVGSIFV